MIPCRLLPAILLLAALPGCRPSYSPDTYSSGAVQQAAKVEQGVIAGVRKVAVSPDGTLGGTAGAAAGGIGGAQAPGSGVRTALTAVPDYTVPATPPAKPAAAPAAAPEPLAVP